MILSEIVLITEIAIDLSKDITSVALPVLAFDLLSPKTSSFTQLKLFS
jgi:hypothetical protein